MRLTRREFMAATAALPLVGSDDPVRLIAHRGGVVDADRPENSAAAVDEAIARGYWMLEVDIRRTRDGRPVLQHDPTFERYYGDPRPVETLTWPDVAALRSRPGDRAPLSFEDVCARCAGHTRLMLDIKGNDHPETFHRALAETLSAHDLLDTVYVLSSGGFNQFWLGKGRLAASPADLRAAIDRGEDLALTHVLFAVAGVLEAADVALAHRHGVTVVAALNTFRYRMAGVDDHVGARADADRLLALGVRQFQIDSIYEPYLRR